MALLFAERVSRQYRGTPYEADVRRAFARIADWLPRRVDLDPARLDEMLAPDLEPVPTPDPAVFRAIVQALLARRRALVRYHSLTSSRRRERCVEPYKVFNLPGTWYLAAHDHLRHAVCDSTDRIDLPITHLVTDLAPWSSLVQRFGRAAR